MKKVNVVILSLFLSACASEPEIITNTVTTNILVKPSFQQIMDCELTAIPPEKGSFSALSQDDKLIALRDYSNALVIDFKICSNRWPQLRSWFKDQEEALNKK